MDQLLHSLFEYQKFEQNKELAKVIMETENRVSAMMELSDDELEFAAGGIKKNPKHKENP